MSHVVSVVILHSALSKHAFPTAVEIIGYLHFWSIEIDAVVVIMFVIALVRCRPEAFQVADSRLVGHSPLSGQLSSLQTREVT